MLVPPLPARRTRRKGFTLIEVLAVTVILLIIAGLGTFAVVSQMGRARENECLLKMQKVEQAAKGYYTQYATWPQSIEVLVEPVDNRPPMLEGGQSAITDPWGKPFNYSVEQDQYGSTRVVLRTTTDSGNPLQWPQR